MKYKLYSIRDKYRGFMQPMMDNSDMATKRSFANAINNGASDMNFAPADFDLYAIAEFDSVSGRIDSIDPIEFICNGSEVFNEK